MRNFLIRINQIYILAKQWLYIDGYKWLLRLRERIRGLEFYGKPWLVWGGILLIIVMILIPGSWSIREREAKKPIPQNNNLVAEKERDTLPPAATPPPTDVRNSIATEPEYNQDDLWLLARVIYGEARGEPYIGQVAVGAVVINRLQHPSFPKTIPGVIFEPAAFTAVDDGQIWLTPNRTALSAAKDALNGWDPTGGALYYFNPVTATSPWIWTRPQILQIGKHIFTV